MRMLQRVDPHGRVHDERWSKLLGYPVYRDISSGETFVVVEDEDDAEAGRLEASPRT